MSKKITESYLLPRERYHRLLEALSAAAVRKSQDRPPRVIPPGLREQFLMEGKAQLLEWYIDSTQQGRSLARMFYSRKSVNACLRRISRGLPGRYGETDRWLYAAMDSYPIEGKVVGIVGSAEPWYEAVCIRYKGRPVTVEYNPRFSDDPRLVFFTPDQFARSGLKLDAVISISSYEHDGLGRYGDPVDPDGDLNSCKELIAHLHPQGHLFLSVPIGIDSIVWNAHRIYGYYRLPRLLENWRVIDVFGIDKDLFSSLDPLVINESLWNSAYSVQKKGIQYVFVCVPR